MRDDGSVPRLVHTWDIEHVVGCADHCSCLVGGHTGVDAIVIGRHGVNMKPPVLVKLHPLSFLSHSVQHTMITTILL